MTIEDEDFSTSGAMNPASDATAITPADTDLARRTRGIYVGTTGDLVVIMAGGTTITFANVVAGSLLPLRVTQIKAATSASDIVALF